jgi:hypothetical protein
MIMDLMKLEFLGFELNNKSLRLELTVLQEHIVVSGRI